MDEWILDDLLECSVCLERLDTSSKVLPCQHTFCKKCLEEILRTHSELRCPECRILVDTKIDDLPPNVLLMRILEGLGGASRKPIVRASTSTITTGNITSTTAVTTTACLQGISRGLYTSSQQHCQQHSTHHSQNSELAIVPQSFPLYQNQPCARATYDYISKEPGDLSFKKGDLILLRKKIDSNWYHGECNGIQGVFPLSYVQIIVPLPTHAQAHCKALYDFKMANDEEDGCLIFRKGDIISVIRRVDENWAEGRLNDKIGIFPLAFVELNSVAKTLLKPLPSDSQAGPSKSAPPAPSAREEGTANNLQQFQVTPLVGLPVTSDSSSTSLTSPSSSCSSTTPTTSSSSHSSPSSPPPPPAPNKRHSFGPTTLHTGNNPKMNRHSAEILNIPDGFIPSQSAVNVDMSAEQCQLVRHGSQRHRRINSSDIAPTPGPQLQHSSLQLPASYVALYPYKPQKGDELELKRGAVYTVTERCQDGWFKGTAARGQKAGVFPGNYVAPAKSLPALQAQVRGLCRTSGSSSTGSPRNGIPPVEPRSLLTYTKPSSASLNNQNIQGSGSENSRTPTQCTDNQAPVPPPPAANASVPSVLPKTSDKVQSRDKKEKCGVSLMRRLASMKKSKSPPPTPYSLDNPVFEDLSLTQHVHIRSGSCPNQLLTSTNVETPHRIFSPNSSHRSKPRERPSISRIAPRMNAERSPPPGVEHRKCNSMDNQTMVTPQDIPSTGNMVRVGEDLTVAPDHIQPPPRASHDFIANQQNQAPVPSRTTIPDNSVLPSRVSNETSNNDMEVKVPAIVRRHGDPNLELKSQNQPPSRPNTQPGPHKIFPSQPKSQSTGHHVRERFRCIVPYPPNSEYELELRLGDVIYVHKKRDDGWYKGTQQRTGRTGLFPASFVQSF
ncbi:hypothetical protein O3M35_003788 [Rhynocoris fuscipes]|uniref:RING-type E3 ubiquitin transferase n=1 Tax=Rhynocoris fuscipes TaxID=488301 RepID=A0AAW1CGG6_9HEMI